MVMHKRRTIQLFLTLYIAIASLPLQAADNAAASDQAHEQKQSASQALSQALRAPLGTFMQASTHLPAQAQAIQALVKIPDDAPQDLGVGAFLKDDDGNWFQLPHTSTLKPGLHHLHFAISLDEPWQSEPAIDIWDPYLHSLAVNYGLFFWSEETNNASIEILQLRAVIHDFPSPETLPQFHTLQFDNIHSDVVTGAQYCHAKTGERWTMQCQPTPMPSNPYDSDLFSLEMQVTGPDGSYSIPGYYQKPLTIIDGGDRDRAVASGAAAFHIRFRPRLPGTYQLTLLGIWNKDSDSEQRCCVPLPDLQVSGAPWDDFIRVDKNDKRYFRVGVNDDFHWPLGLNIRSVTDPRGTQRTNSQITPERIVHAYKAYFDRLALAGGNNVEIWMASWNVGLEWLDDWPGFHGIGAYNEANAQRLDEILDYAYSKGIRVILVINNHGQASFKTDREWSYSPFNADNGGPLTEAKDFFTHPVPLHAQQERRRYIVARYADHPAILCWKLFSEMNLTDMARNGVDGPAQMRKWHANAFDAWRALDIYDHPVTSHWSGDYRTPYRELVALPNMDFTAIDAYHGRRGGNGRLLANIMYDSTLHKEYGLSAFNKPLVVTEFGASAGAGPEPQLIAEHMSGPWAALMSGHASSPHLWWFEWTDQGDRWHPYRAIHNYLAGEDFRSTEARCVFLDIKDQDTHSIWCRAWFKPKMIYAYLLDWNWGFDGTQAPLHQAIEIRIGNKVQAGRFELEWWDASLGVCLSRTQIQHQTGPLVISSPAFRRHLAFKLRRTARDDNDVSTTE